MRDINQRLAAFGVKIPDILLPGPEVDPEKWAVIACDQHTQDPSYWETVRAITDSAPSALNLILPETFLGDGSGEPRISSIHASMRKYLKGGVFSAPSTCVIYVERETSRYALRRGLVMAVDLELYDWKTGNQALIRATEETIEERLPPRMEIRRNASLETSHIILLMDDDKDALLPALAERAKKKPPLYSTPLMLDSGSITGWALDSEEDWEILAGGLEKLMYKDGIGRRYETREPFLFAVGDGNHSLAAAKAVWDEYKKTHAGETGLENHPCRWALVELENLYDPGVIFEPIHRLVFGTDPDMLVSALSAQTGITLSPHVPENRIISAESNSPCFISALLQPLLDDFVMEHGLSIDYIHGEKELCRLAQDTTRPATGVLLPAVEKKDLFKTVTGTGALPRKSFSMGASADKRFYFECRSLLQ